jgi:hypothetical protein
MRFRRFSRVAVLCIMGLNSIGIAAGQTEPSPPQPDFQQLLHKMAGGTADSCGGPWSAEHELVSPEDSVFEQAVDAVTDSLNAPESGKATPKGRASSALKELERQSAEINASWPVENRFHFEVVDLAPALLVTMSIRSQGNYFAFGIPAEDDYGKPNRQWKKIGEGYPNSPDEVPYTSVALYPLHRGPSGNPRFLASFVISGCAGSWGIRYDVEEWQAKSETDIAPILKQEGSVGMGDEPIGTKVSPKHPFPPIGELKTEGTIVTLPYCWFSAIDTWDNPSMCAVDTYDLSGDAIRFVSERYNRPDLLPVARAIEYAEKHDYPAVLAYCGSAAVARKIVRELANGYQFEYPLEVKRIGPGRERVRLADSGDPGFVVERRGDRWVVASLSPE